MFHPYLPEGYQTFNPQIYAFDCFASPFSYFTARWRQTPVYSCKLRYF